MENFFILAETEVNAGLVVMNICIAAGLLLFTSWVYQKTHNTLSYAQSSLYSMALIGTMSCAIVMVVTQNIFGAFAFFIIFTLIRFRSVIKETRDTIFLLFALLIGVTVGRSMYIPAITVTLTISSLILIFNYGGFYRRNIREHILVLYATSALSFKDKAALDHSYILRSSSLLKNGLYKYVISLQNSSRDAAEQAMQDLGSIPGVERIEFMNKQEVLEY